MSYVFLFARLIAMLFIGVTLARLASALGGALERRDASEPVLPLWRRRLARVVLLLVAMALAECELGGLYVFTDPLGTSWDFDGHGWPLIQPTTIADALSMAGPTQVAIYWIALVVDGLVFIALLVAARHVLVRWLAPTAFGLTPRQVLKRELPGWLASLGLVLLAERWMARPTTLPGTEMVIYTTLLYEPWYVHAGVLFGVASLVFLAGVGAARVLKILWRLREEGVL